MTTAKVGLRRKFQADDATRWTVALEVASQAPNVRSVVIRSSAVLAAERCLTEYDAELKALQQALNNVVKMEDVKRHIDVSNEAARRWYEQSHAAAWDAARRLATGGARRSDDDAQGIG